MTDLPFDEVAIQVASGYSLLSAEEFLSRADATEIATLISEQRVTFLHAGIPIEAGAALQGLEGESNFTR